MSPRSIVLTLLAVSLASAVSGSAHAHFKLLKPASWLNEDSVGGPQKGSPCGPGGTGLLGDDVQPVPLSSEVTTFTAGQKVTVEIDETIYHPGYFRIALAEDRSKFDIPPVDNPSSCALDLSKVKEGPRDDYVLADGLFKEESLAGSNRKLTYEVTLPNKPCDKCTLQVVQVMKDHGLSSCYYYHCADIKITAASGGAAGAAGAPQAGSAGAAAGAGAAGQGGATSVGSAGASAGAGGMSVAGSAAAGSGASVAGSGVAGQVSGAAGATPAGGSGTGATTAGIGSVSSPVTGAAGTGIAAVAGTTAVGAAGAAVPVATPVADDGGSCSVTNVSSSVSNTLAAAVWGLLASVLLVRRRRRATARTRRA